MKQCSVSDCPRHAESKGMCHMHYRKQWRVNGPDPYVRKDEPLKCAVAALNTKTNECILWPFAKVTGGYGAMSENGRPWMAHRYVCTKAHGAPPIGAHALHTCGVASCVNPAHLRWGTPLENMRDKYRHGTMTMGEAVKVSKLTADQVREIKADTTSRPIDIARRFGVDDSTICDIRKGRTWKHVR